MNPLDLQPLIAQCSESQSATAAEHTESDVLELTNVLDRVACPHTRSSHHENLADEDYAKKTCWLTSASESFLRIGIGTTIVPLTPVTLMA
jgi:hypothetical protein